MIDGQERHIRRLLEEKRFELFPPQLPPLGPRVKIMRKVFRNTTGYPPVSKYSNQRWKPEKVLISRFPEHTGAISNIAMAPDHSFFASSSADGTVKIFDTRRLHVNVTNRARLSYSGHGSSNVLLRLIKCVCCYLL